MDLKKIICYGIGNVWLRRKMNILISDKYEIIGYTDTFLKEDFLQGEKYIEPEHIDEYEYDYIVILAEQESTQMAIKEKLQDLGVLEEKVVVPSYLYQDNLCFVPDLVKIKKEELDNQVNGVICGLSYSLYGVDEKKLCGSWVNFSWHSMDLYYNYCFLKMTLLKAEIKKCILCIPYYYFNYDMSWSEYAYKSGTIYACRGFNDWHNATNTSAGIKNYLVNEDLFGNRMWSILWEGGRRWNSYAKQERSVDIAKKYELGAIWQNRYELTIRENIGIMEKILMLCNEKNIVPTVIIPPILTSCLKDDSLALLEKGRKEFYEIIARLENRFSMYVYDFVELYKDRRELFFDYEHLNEMGKQEFTKRINEIIND